MTCTKWRECVSNHVVAVRAYSQAVEDLAAVTEGQFNLAWERCERARKKANSSREALLEHEHEHGCVGAHSAAASKRASHSR